ncbi:MAG: N-formylglutamate deformylase [Deltaproteobacteria bacterium]|jgi:formiminoglutamase|nr:N-formylglutamate deformylase [Deltaproteobacteria bacterium]
MNPVKIIDGSSPVILAQPHGGTFVPVELSEHYNELGRKMADTDWHIHRLYDGLLPDASVVEATFSRYLIDANRDPSGSSLYPGQNTTDLCPTVDFEGRPIYQKRALHESEPDANEIETRRNNYHAVYHAALSAQIERVRKIHGKVLLFDCHSIRSRLPFLFEGELPDFNLGTNNTSTCDPIIEEAAVEVCANAKRDLHGYSYVINARFKGGWTTRHYGKPDKGIHAIQLELAQQTYMDESSPWLYREEKAAKLRIHLKKLLSCLEQTITTLN